MSKKIVTNIFKHIKLVCKHKWYVFKFCCRLGIPIRGVKHDLSKFSFWEFWESVKYYDSEGGGKISPIEISRNKNGYSLAWLHHKGINKHHDQYWVDLYNIAAVPIIPYKYMAEMVCDKLSASIVYNGKDWTPASEYEYWKIEQTKIIMNPKCTNFLTEVFTEVKDNGIDKTITKKNIEYLYKKNCIDDKSVYKYEFHGEWKKLED